MCQQCVITRYSGWSNLRNWHTGNLENHDDKSYLYTFLTLLIQTLTFSSTGHSVHQGDIIHQTGPFFTGDCRCPITFRDAWYFRISITIKGRHFSSATFSFHFQRLIIFFLNRSADTRWLFEYLCGIFSCYSFVPVAVSR